ncbi:hypothetical protein HU830_07180 [Lactobacillus sp. DCY120]|uniref:Core-binding (CB) domain-containing protein n=1 Tax=Bombilactobacillus apium TaxID=2675299 RepID=A0A850R4N2_9LACO|nr:hypothetical protein [Bombilactobacillus apium]NVY96931.1 hypothetical protein [Bombilactobacillus apium]
MAQIYKRGKTWGCRVSFIDKSGFKRKSDATDAAREIELRKKATNVEKREIITFADYFSNWIQVYKLGKYSRNTELRYLAFGKKIYEYFGNTLLKDITKANYQQFIDQYSVNRSKASVRRVNGYVSTIVHEAIEEQLIYRDFTHNILISGSEPKADNLKFLELDEASRLKQYAYERRSLKAVSFSLHLPQGVAMAK